MGIDITKSSIHVFQSQERLELLNDIDKFRRHGLANLPQIVVCGDTSSGKSSVLGAMSGVAFPVNSTICTRFATEFALRYTSDDAVTGQATISAAPKSSDAHRSRVESFHKVISSLDDIPGIMEEAKQTMDLSHDASISRDVLHLEIHGRDLPNLTLVDLPGLIHAAEDMNDVRKVEDLIDYYFTQTESIILIVVSAENPINNQGILAKAQSFDPAGERSIGVITKADQVLRPDKRGLLPTIVTLGKNENQTFRFKRPWHIVRCLNDDERCKNADREALERDLFQQDPWDTFDYTQLGIHSLIAALSTYLQDHIIRVLPELIESLENKIDRVSRELTILGPPRATHRELEQYLVNISSQYTALVKDALAGNYSDPFFQYDDKETTRLRAATMAVIDRFEESMRSQGHSFEITQSSSPRSIQHRYTTSTSSAGAQHQHDPDRINLSEALAKVDTLLKSHRGPELSFLFNPGLVGELFKEQSKKWPSMATDCTEEMCRVVRTFLRKVVEYICPQTGQMAERVLRHIFDDALENLQETLGAKNSELLGPYKGSFLYSKKSRLQASLKAIEQEDSMEGDIEEKARLATGTEGKVIINGSNTDPATRADEATCKKMLQYSRAYYNVASDSFVDNIVTLGFEACLLSNLSDIFSPQTVSRMDDEMLQLLAGESPRQMRQREDLQRDLQTLKSSLKTCKRHDSRAFRNGNTTAQSETHEQENTAVVKIRVVDDPSESNITTPHRPRSTPKTRRPVVSFPKSPSLLPSQTTSPSHSVLSTAGEGSGVSKETKDKAPSNPTFFGPQASVSPISSGPIASPSGVRATSPSVPAAFGQPLPQTSQAPATTTNSNGFGSTSSNQSGSAAGLFSKPLSLASPAPATATDSKGFEGFGSTASNQSGSAPGLFGNSPAPATTADRKGFGSTASNWNGTGFGTSVSPFRASLSGADRTQTSTGGLFGGSAAMPTSAGLSSNPASISSSGTSTESTSTPKSSGDSGKAIVAARTSAGSSEPSPAFSFGKT